MGLQKTLSHQHIESFDDPDLSGLTQEVPAVIERAIPRWKTSPSIRLTSDLLPRPRVGPGMVRARSRLHTPRRRQTYNNPKRRGCSKGRTLASWAQLGVTGQIANPIAGGRHKTLGLLQYAQCMRSHSRGRPWVAGCSAALRVHPVNSRATPCHQLVGIRCGERFPRAV